MITPQEAEKRAHELIEQYVNAASCDTIEDVANVLMKLASLTGLAMAAVVGRDEAVGRMVSVVANTSGATIPKAIAGSALRMASSSRVH